MQHLFSNYRGEDVEDEVSNEDSAPVVVDKDGNFYGYFSANPYLSQRTTISSLVWLLDNYDWVIENLDQVRAKFE